MKKASRTVSLVLTLAMIMSVCACMKHTSGNGPEYIDEPSKPEAIATSEITLPTETEETPPTETTPDPVPDADQDADVQYMTIGTGNMVINLWTYTVDVPKLIMKFGESNPTFMEKYTVECTIISNGGDAYQNKLDAALAAGGSDAPDIYVAEEAFVYKYTQGDMSKYAASYSELGLDVQKEIANSEIASYVVDIGTNPDGDVVGLAYQAGDGAMIYRASIAKEVFGTDDPAKIESIIGGGSGNWAKFLEAAEQLRAKGYVAVSGSDDIWQVCQKCGQPWIVNSQLYIDPAREGYLDVAKTLKDDGLSNDHYSWTEDWFNDMKGAGDKEVFAFFGPAWFLNYTMSMQCGDNVKGTMGDWRVCLPPVGFYWGGTWVMANKNTDMTEGVATLIHWLTLDCTETGGQYMWAYGLLSSGYTCDGVASGKVMMMGKGAAKTEICGDQDVYAVFRRCNDLASGKGASPYDAAINRYFHDAADQYANGELSRDDALERFKTNLTDNLTF